MTVLQQIEALGILPVITIDRVEDARPLAQALMDGGLPAAEVTFRTKAAEAAIREIAQAHPQLLLGAGTILTAEQCDQAVAAGAKFVISPACDDRLIDHCREKGVLLLPGCLGPSDFARAAGAGLEAVKFFPAEQAGGVSYLKAVAPVFPQLRFMPTGGVNQSNVADYLAYPRVLACGGSWMVPRDMLAAGDFAGITRLCREAMLTVMGFEVAHIGINAANDDAAQAAARQLTALFGFAEKPGSSSIFSSQRVEIMRRPYLGSHGHIGVAVNDVDRARAWLEGRGVVFRMDTAKYDADGRLKAVYLGEELCGFALHLMRKS